MTRTKKITYWISTIWLGLGMASTGVVQFLGLPEQIKPVIDLGYPSYFLTIIGVWKILGVIAVLLPRFALVKEWAYAGFFFLMSGALVSHFAMGSALMDYFGPSLLIVLTAISWYTRPEDRKLPA